MLFFEKFFVFFFITVLIPCHLQVAGWLFFGASPRLFSTNDTLSVKVDRSTSPKTQIHLSHYEFPYCRPPVIHDQVENIGEVLQGNQLQNSPIEFQMLRNVSCKVICTKTLQKEDIESFKEAILNEYDTNMWLDDLPVLTSLESVQKTPEKETFLEVAEDVTENASELLFVGIPVGTQLHYEKEHPLEILVNHWEFIIDYHRENDSSRSFFSSWFEDKEALNSKKNHYVITGFKVIPRSLAYPYNDSQLGQGILSSSKLTSTSSDPLKNDICNAYLSGGITSSFRLDGPPPQKVSFSYSVSFHESDALWKSRWDRYFQIGDSKNVEIHWFGVANSVFVVILLSFLTYSILRYTISKDITLYNRLDDSELDMYPQDDFGWKLIHGDVFRRPPYGRFLAAFTGSGIELFAVFFSVLIAFISGMVSFEERGSFIRCALFFYAILGLLGGYVAVSVASLFEKSNVQRTLAVTYLSAFLLPGISFAVFSIINFMLQSKNSSTAIAFLTLFKLFFLWFGVNVPLVFIGAYLAQRRGPPSVPVRTNQIPSQIPMSPWYLRPLVAPFFTGIFPFCAVLTDVLFIYTSIWHHQYYLFFGFILITLCILAVTSSLVSIVYTYLLLSAENHRWWWPSFWASGFSGVYLFLYSIFYYTTFGGTSLFALVTYFSYSLLICFIFTLLTGSIGFLSSFHFVKKIYSAVKVD